MPHAKGASDLNSTPGHVVPLACAEVEAYDFSPEEAYEDLGATNSVPQLVFSGNLAQEELTKQAKIDNDLRISSVGHTYVQVNVTNPTAVRIPMDPKLRRTSAFSRGQGARK